MCSPIGHSTQFCSVLFEALLCDLGGVNRRLALQRYNRDVYPHRNDINVICELLAVKHSYMELDLCSKSVLNAFSNAMNAISFCVLLNFLKIFFQFFIVYFVRCS